MWLREPRFVWDPHFWFRSVFSTGKKGSFGAATAQFSSLLYLGAHTVTHTRQVPQRMGD